MRKVFGFPCHIIWKREIISTATNILARKRIPKVFSKRIIPVDLIELNNTKFMLKDCIVWIGRRAGWYISESEWNEYEWRIQNILLMYPSCFSFLHMGKIDIMHCKYSFESLRWVVFHYHIWYVDFLITSVCFYKNFD